MNDMARQELIAKKQKDIIGALNLGVIMISGDTDFESIREQVVSLIDILKKDLDALDGIDEYLRLQELILD